MSRATDRASPGLRGRVRRLSRRARRLAESWRAALAARRREPSDALYVAPYWDGYGDLWAVVSYACLLSQREHRPVGLSKFSTKSMRDREAEIRAILGQLDERWTEGVFLTARTRTEVHRFSVRDHDEPYVPTRLRWAPNDSRIIACHLDPSTRHRPERFCQPDFRERLREALPAYRLVDVGRPHQSDLAETIGILSTAELFVGVDSGMSHVAHSVGIPVFLKNYADLARCHPGKEYVPFDGAADLIARL